MVLRTAVRAAAITGGTIFVGMLVGLMTIFSDSEVSTALTTGSVTRSVLVLALLLVMARAFRLRDRKAADTAGRPYQHVLIAAGLACAVNVIGWGGQALFGQVLVSAGVFSAVIDVVAWMGVAILGVLLGDRAPVEASVAPVPYA